uniref:Uncharacterized protein n=1 Tax=Trichuris muris TaxID=70415 RepID=A0A5S6QKT0_TRIMR
MARPIRSPDRHAFRPIPADWANRRSPCFWLNAMKNTLLLARLIRFQDELALVYLVDIRTEILLWPRTLRIIFEFYENPFFENQFIFKDYRIKLAVRKRKNRLEQRVKVIWCKCCPIIWHNGMKPKKRFLHKKMSLSRRNQKRRWFFFEFLQFNCRGGMLRKGQLKRNFLIALFIHYQFLPNIHS